MHPFGSHQLATLALVMGHHPNCNGTTYGGVQVDEDGAGNIFPVSSFGEEGLARASILQLLRIGVRTSIGQQAMLKEVSATT